MFGATKKLLKLAGIAGPSSRRESISFTDEKLHFTPAGKPAHVCVGV